MTGPPERCAACTRGVYEPSPPRQMRLDGGHDTFHLACYIAGNRIAEWESNRGLPSIAPPAQQELGL